MAGGQAVGHKIFSKQLTATDLDHTQAPLAVGLAAGNDVIPYSSEDPTAHFAIRFNKKVMLFGSNINDAQI
ncbi:hypothetical protein V2J09_020196 [Rumex salicifolius]